MLYYTLLVVYISIVGRRVSRLDLVIKEVREVSVIFYRANYNLRLDILARKRYLDYKIL